MHLCEINSLVNSILSHCKNDYVIDLDATIDLLLDNTYGTLTEKNAMIMIEASKKKEIFAQLLPFVLNFSDSNTISNRVFAKIIGYGEIGTRREMLISIAHCPLAFYQLQFICNEKVCFEAFATMLDIYLEHDCFTPFDLHMLLSENVEYLASIDWHSILTANVVKDNKRMVIQNYLIDIFD